MERLLFLTDMSRVLPTWARYGATTLLVVACLGLHLLVFGSRPGMPFLLFVPAIIIAGIAFNHGTGIYASLLSAVLAVYFLLDPYRSFDLSGPDLLGLVVFLGVALFTAALLETLHVALRRLTSERRKLSEASIKLQRLADSRTTLLSEAVHRARNDLQRLAATLHVQSSLSDVPAAKQALIDASERVMALARINSRLDLHRADGDPEIDSKGFIDGLVEDLRNGLVSLRPIALVSSAESHMVPMAQAVPFGLIINELVVNVLKYAFPDGMEGRVQIRFQRVDGHYLLSVEDDGVGFDPAARPQGTGIGTQIVRSMTAQMGGHLELAPALSDSNRPGVRWTLRLPVGGLA